MDGRCAFHLQGKQEARPERMDAVVLTAWLCFFTWLCCWWKINGIKCFFSGTVMQEHGKIPHLNHGAGEWGTSDHLPSPSFD